MLLIIYILLFSVTLLAWSLYRQLTGKDHRKFAQPMCSNCRSDLRDGWNDSMCCHQCGQSLEDPFNVYFGRKSKPITPRKIWLRVVWVTLLFYMFFGFWHLHIALDHGFSIFAQFKWFHIFPFLIFPFSMMINAKLTISQGSGLPRINHPFCSQCEYDLRVNWRHASECPECGQDLSQDDAVYFGRSAIRVKTSYQRYATGFALVFILLVLSINLFGYLKDRFKTRPAVAPTAVTVPLNTPTSTSNQAAAGYAEQGDNK